MRYVFFTFLAMVIFSSCKKEDTPTPEPTSTTPFNMVSESNAWYHDGGYLWNVHSDSARVVGDVIIVSNDFMSTSSARKFYFKGDTLINSILYKKMYYDAIDTTYRNGVLDSDEMYTEYIASMRQDGSKVYYIDKYMWTEALYADMSASVGEVLNYHWNSGDARVESISYTMVGSNEIKVYTLDNGEVFFEGIGAAKGLFKGWGIAIHGDSYLERFTRDGHEVLIDDFTE